MVPFGLLLPFTHYWWRLGLLPAVLQLACGGDPPSRVLTGRATLLKYVNLGEISFVSISFKASTFMRFHKGGPTGDRLGSDGCSPLGQQDGMGLLWGQMASGGDAGRFPLKASRPEVRLVFSSGGFVVPVGKLASCSQ